VQDGQSSRLVHLDLVEHPHNLAALDLGDRSMAQLGQHAAFEKLAALIQAAKISLALDLSSVDRAKRIVAIDLGFGIVPLGHIGLGFEGLAPGGRRGKLWVSPQA
jgi:hypothetical protein